MRLRSRFRAGGRQLARVLDFATLTPAALASRLSWVRTGAGTMEESGGDVRYGAHNLLPYSSDFTNAAWTKSDCSVSGQVVTKTAASPWLYQVAATATGQSYVTWFDVEAGTATSCKIFCINQGVAVYEATFDLIAGTVSAVTVGSAATIIGLGGGVFRCTLQRVHTIGAANDIFGLTVLGSQGDSLTVHRGQLNLGPVALDYVPTTTAPVYLMRTPDYTHGVAGLLLEGQRTNLWDLSEAFQGWTKFNSTTVVSDAVAAPSGALTADTIVASTSSGIQGIYRGTPSLTIGTTYTFTVYVKAGGYQYASIFSANTGDIPSALFDLSNGTVVSTTGTASIQSIGNGWCRCCVTKTAAAGGVDLLAISISSAGTPGQYSPSFAGDGTSGICVWGADMQAGAYPTSYIPNTGTGTVTRAADVAEIGPGAEFDALFPAAQGTIVVEWVGLGASVDGDLLTLHAAGSIAESMAVYLNGGVCAFFSRAGGTNQLTPSLGTPNATGVNRVAFSWGASGLAAVLNGGTVYASAGATLPAPTHARFAGATLVQGSQAAWKPTKITTLPDQKTGAALQALTT